MYKYVLVINLSSCKKLHIFKIVRYIMGKIYIIISTIFFLTSCKAQSFHKDQMEYGYKGKVKVIIKKNFAHQIVFDDNIIPSDSNSVTTYTYYFNKDGNMDSAKTERMIVSGEIFFYKTIYKFDKLRKTEWTAYGEDNEKLLYGKIIWASDQEFTEKVYGPDDIPKYEIKTILNDSFRIIKTIIKAFDNVGNLVQDDIQEFQLDKSQNIELYKTIRKNDETTEITNYKYLNTDKVGNPTKLIISKENQDTITIVTMDYTYYE